MKRFRRAFLFLLLNVLVSACTTLAVLLIWDHSMGPFPKGLLSSMVNPNPVVEGTPSAQGGVVSLMQPAPTEAFITIQVGSGDTLESLAERYNMSVDELIAINDLPESKELEPEQTLRIPVHPKGTVMIESVVGASDLDSEHVLLKHRGEGELSLVGWRIEDGRGNVFVFPQTPQLVLFSGGAVNIYTRSGVNTVIDLYWGLDHAVWIPGTTVILRDAQGNIRSTYDVP